MENKAIRCIRLELDANFLFFKEEFTEILIIDEEYVIRIYARWYLENGK